MQIYIHLNDLVRIKVRSLIRFFACAQSFHSLKNLIKMPLKAILLDCEEMSVHHTENIPSSEGKDATWERNSESL